MELATVPSGWNTFTLGELFEFSNGVNADKSAYGEGIPFVNVLDVIENEALMEAAIPGRIKLSSSLAARYQVRCGDVLLNRTSETQDEVALASVYLGDSPVVFGGFVFRARPKTNNLDRGYSKYALRANRVREQIVARGQGGIRANIGQRDLKTVHVSLPPVDEQRTIAVALSDVDALIAMLERMIAKKRANKQAMMQQLLTGKTRLPGFGDPWIDFRLGEIARIKTGSRNNQDKESYGQYPFFVRSATVERIDSYSYDCKAILVPGEGGIGSIFHYINGKFEVHQRVYKISNFAERVSGRFVYHYMRQFFGAHAMENSVKATVDSLRLPTFSGFKLHLPAKVDEQQAIVSVLDDAENEIELLQRRLTKARSTKTGMMQQLLTGRTRLPVKEGVA
ncbi:MAG: restriction endonuclease subunit S [Pseudonocardiaceae bacterium]